MHKGAMILIDAATADAIYAAMPPGQESSGGSAANTCAVAANLGSRVAYIGKVADDQLGARVPPRHQRRRRAFPNRAVVGRRAHRALPDPGHAGRPAHDEHVPGRLCHPERGRRRSGLGRRLRRHLPGRLSVRSARRPGRVPQGRRRCPCRRSPVALSLSDAFCVNRHRAAFLDLVAEHVDILFANEAEITALYERNTFEEAAEAARRDVALAALTRSEAGSLILQGEEDGEGRRRTRQGCGHDRCRRCLRRRVPGRPHRRQDPGRCAAAWAASPRPKSSATTARGRKPTCAS